MAVLANMARMTTATTGAGTITLGDAVDGFLSFADAGITDGQTVSYAIEDGVNREVGTGVYSTSGTTLTRTVVNSTNSGTAISLSGEAEVFITALAADFMTDAERSKLAGVEAGATANQSDTYLLDRGNHTGQDAISDVNGLSDALDAKAPVNNPSFTGSVTLPGNPSGNLHAATKQYVDAQVASVASKFATVRAATTGNVNISTALNNGDTLDGVTLATGDRVLVRAQSTASQNGVYVVGTSPVRATDFDAWDEFPGALITVWEGTANGDTMWLCTSNKTGTVGSTAITFQQMQIAGELLASNNLADVQSAAAAFAAIKQAATTSATGVVQIANLAAWLARTVGIALTADGLAASKAAVALAYSATRSLAWKDGWFRSTTLTGNMAMSNATGVEEGDTILLFFIGSSATERAITWGTDYKGNLPDVTVTSSRALLVSLTGMPNGWVATGHMVLE